MTLVKELKDLVLIKHSAKTRKEALVEIQKGAINKSRQMDKIASLSAAREPVLPVCASSKDALQGKKILSSSKLSTYNLQPTRSHLGQPIAITEDIQC